MRMGFYIILAFMAVWVGAVACDDSSPATLDGGTDGDSDSDSDGNSDTDGDSDSDSDSDTDSDGDVPCTVSVGPPDAAIDLSGTCQDDPTLCEGGYDAMNTQGTCGGADETCCIDTDQCETTMGVICAATSEECEGTPPMGDEFPQMGCPPATPFCCVGGPA